MDVDVFGLQNNYFICFMISIQLCGGLGNQMFQYAAARSLEEFHCTDLKLDLGWYSQKFDINTTLRNYELQCFKLNAMIANEKEKEGFAKRNASKWYKLCEKFKPISRKRVYYEPYYHYNPKFFCLSKNVYLYGYYQSEKYFKSIRNILLTEFNWKTLPSGKNKEVLELIDKTESVSLHIRRGDYISNSTANKQHGVCSLSYYQKCLADIKKHLTTPHFFVFSDDIPWAKENLKVDAETTFVDHNNIDHGFEDMRLMSHCKHNIIANSSFSWWGAWLNKNSEKKVYAPKKWFQIENHNTKDLIPEDWTKV